MFQKMMKSILMIFKLVFNKLNGYKIKNKNIFVFFCFLLTKTTDWMYALFVKNLNDGAVSCKNIYRFVVL